MIADATTHKRRIFADPRSKYEGVEPTGCGGEPGYFTGRASGNDRFACFEAEAFASSTAISPLMPAASGFRIERRCASVSTSFLFRIRWPAQARIEPPQRRPIISPSSAVALLTHAFFMAHMLNPPPRYIDHTTILSPR
jgi:hypothetical protein